MNASVEFCRGKGCLFPDLDCADCRAVVDAFKEYLEALKPAHNLTIEVNISNLTRYTMVVRRDQDGFATAAGKVRQNGEWVKFDDIVESAPSASCNSRYVTALEVLRDYKSIHTVATLNDFIKFCNERLNATK